MAAAVLVDSNVILDIFTNDPIWSSWSSKTLAAFADDAVLVINPLIYAEVSVRFDSIEDLENALPAAIFRRDPLPYEAGFLAAKAFVTYRRGGSGTPLPDFYIGAHAAVAGFRLLTRDIRRYRTYFPKLEIVSPAY